MNCHNNLRAHFLALLLAFGFLSALALPLQAQNLNSLFQQLVKPAPQSPSTPSGAPAAAAGLLNLLAPG